MDRNHSNTQATHGAHTRARRLGTISFLLVWFPLTWHLITLSVSTSQHQVTPFLSGETDLILVPSALASTDFKMTVQPSKNKANYLIKCLILSVFVGHNCGIEGCLCCCKVCFLFLKHLMCSLWLLVVSTIYKLCFAGSKSRSRNNYSKTEDTKCFEVILINNIVFTLSQPLRSKLWSLRTSYKHIKVHTSFFKSFSVYHNLSKSLPDNFL